VQDQAGNLASQLRESQKEMARLRADLHRAEFDLERERSQLREGAAVADREKVSRSVSRCLCWYLWLSVCYHFVMLVRGYRQTPAFIV